jgi:hypothetical protein
MLSRVNRLRISVLAAAALVAVASSNTNGTAVSGGLPPQGYVAPASTTVEGQGFTGTDGTDRINFYFRKGGVLHYRDPQGWWEDGKWQQQGAQVTFWLSGGFATYTGTLVGTVISGTAVNQQKKSWNFRVQQGTPRQPPSVDLTATRWGGKEDKDCVVLEFKPAGVLEYDTPSGHFTDATWELDGDWVFIRDKKAGFEYFGNVKAQHMNGNLWSKDGQHWSWDVNRDVVPDGCGKAVASRGEKSGGPTIATIEGSVWEGDNGGDPIALTFKPGGVLHAHDAEGDYKGSWFQNGIQVSFDLNGRYSWYEGQLDASGGSMGGGGKNKDGLEWKFLVKKKK